MIAIIILLLLLLLVREDDPKPIRELPEYTPPPLGNGLVESSQIFSKRSI